VWLWCALECRGLRAWVPSSRLRCHSKGFLVICFRTLVAQLGQCVVAGRQASIGFGKVEPSVSFGHCCVAVPGRAWLVRNISLLLHGAFWIRGAESSLGSMDAMTLSCLPEVVSTAEEANFDTFFFDNWLGVDDCVARAAIMLLLPASVSHSWAS